MRYSDELATSATYTLGGGLSRISVLLNSGGGGLSTSEQQDLWMNLDWLTQNYYVDPSPLYYGNVDPNG